jgi:hypothetical protein
MIKTVMDRLVKYAADMNIWIHLFLIPINVYTVPDSIKKTPATDSAGVIAGGRGRVVVSVPIPRIDDIFVTGGIVTDGMREVVKEVD